MCLRSNKGPGWPQQRAERGDGAGTVAHHRRRAGPARPSPPVPHFSAHRHAQAPANTLPGSARTPALLLRQPVNTRTHTVAGGHALALTLANRHALTRTLTLYSLTHCLWALTRLPRGAAPSTPPACRRGTGAPASLPVEPSVAPPQPHPLQESRPVPEASDPCPQTNSARETPQKVQV